MITVYMQLCEHSDYSSVKQSVLFCGTAVLLLPFCILVATLSQLLYTNIQAVRIAAMHEASRCQ